MQPGAATGSADSERCLGRTPNAAGEREGEESGEERARKAERRGRGNQVMILVPSHGLFGLTQHRQGST